MTRPKVTIRCHQLTNVAVFDALAREIMEHADVRLVTDAPATNVTIDGVTTNGAGQARARLLRLRDQLQNGSTSTSPAPPANVLAALTVLDSSLSKFRQAQKLYAVGQVTTTAFENAARSLETAIANVRRAIAKSTDT